MFIHYFAGCMIFLLGALYHDWSISSSYLLLGAFCGALADWLSLAWGNIGWDKNSHKHRDNISHSLLVPIIAFLLVGLFDIKLAFIIGLALVSHPLLDTFGIGWGVKLFYPFSDISVKIDHIKGKYLYQTEEIEQEAKKFGDDNWIKNLYFKVNLFSLTEWTSLIITLSIIISVL